MALTKIIPAKPRNWRRPVGVAAGVLAVAGGAAWLWASRPPAPTADPVTVAKYVGSPAFEKLSADDRQAFVAAAREANPRPDFRALDALSTEERARAMVNFMSSGRANPAAEYFKLPAGPQRVAYLDRMIDDAEKRSAERRQRAATRPARADGPPGGGAGPGGARGAGWRDPAFRKAMDDLIPPAQKAEFAEFRSAMNKRRAERGLPERGGWGPR